MTFNIATDPLSTLVCGVNTFVTNFTWATVLVPANPATQSYELSVNTNDVLLAGSHVVVITIGYTDPLYTQTSTVSISVTINHPCILTVISSSQTISDIYYLLGDPKLNIPFVLFSDSVSAEYGNPTLCALTYQLSLASDATNFGASVNSSTL